MILLKELRICFDEIEIYFVHANFIEEEDLETFLLLLF